jgi:hypothetical protein
MFELISIAHAGVITDAPSISSVGVKILFFLLSVAGIIAIISLVLAGALYFFSAGDEGRMKLAKRAMTASVVGIIMALGGMVVVNFIGQFFGK